MADRIRLGIVGAGNFTKTTVLPNFKKLSDDVDVIVVCNRREENAKAVAEQFGVPEIATDYRNVVGRDDLDAIFVGTPPYAHKEIVLAALDANKHVLVQTRFAENSEQARAMYDRAQEKAGEGVKTMLARPDSFVKGDKFVRHLLETGYVGRVYQVIAYRIWPNFVDSKAPLQRRQDIRAFGAINPMHIGFYWDVLQPWFGYAKRVLAQSHIFTPEREETPGGPRIKIELPDTVTAIAETESGAIVTNIQLWAARFGSSKIEIYGEDGTIVYDNKGDQIWGARAGDKELAPLPIPPELEERWHLEEDFVKFIKGEIPEGRPSFHDGLKNIEYLEAVNRSSKEGRWVELPA